MPSSGTSHLHLDPVGGIAGDMFVAAVLDARPDLEAEVAKALRGIGLPRGVEVRREEGEDHHFRGSRLRITGLETAEAPGRSVGDLSRRLAEGDLPASVRERALDMLARLAAAEARVHGIPVEEVHFHEIASWDTLVDFVAAATVIAAAGVETASVGPLPMGRGRVASEHGALPVPAPATVELLKGLELVDDGIAGERVTPTGATILAHLRPLPRLPRAARLQESGVGLGTRRLPHLANMLRVLFLAVGTESVERDVVGVIRFEIDDMSGEDLAIGIEAIRARPEVVDVCCWPAFGKKGRLATAVQVLCEPQALDGVAEARLLQTGTLGLRTAIERRVVLRRETVRVETAAGPVRVKRAWRPDGRVTGKAEADDVAALARDLASRRRLRELAERQAEEEE